MAKTDIYEEPSILRTKNAIIKVYKPILTEEERARRMKIIHDAAASLFMSMERQQSKTKKEETKRD